MSESNKMNHSDDVLLSAYLDGELDEAQRAKVEQRLGQDPAARELLSQLQSVSESVSSLPKYGLGDDLREAVLSQFEVERREEMPPESVYRRWVYAAAAIAAALLLTIYQPSQEGNNQQVAGLGRGATPKISAEAGLNAPATDQRPALGSFGSFWGSQQGSSLSEIVERSLSNTVTRPARIPLSGDQLSGASPEDFHVHLQSADSNSGFKKFQQLLSRAGIVFLDRSHESDMDAETANLDMFLVEAPLFAIRQVMAGCGQDQSVWKSAQILRPNKSAPSILFLTFPKEQPETIGADDFYSPKRSRDYGGVEPQGWAKHLNRNRLESDLVGGFNSQPTSHGQSTIRVLFFLHPASE